MTVSTFTVAADADDGQTDQTGATYPPTGAVGLATTGQNQTVQRILAGGNFTVQTFLARWDTSSIPDADVVSAADLKLYIRSKSDANARSFVADWMADAALSTADHTNTAGTDAHSGTTIASLTTSAINTFALQNLSNVSKTAFTKLRCHVSGGEPTGLNQIGVTDFWDPTDPPADLVVTHAAPTTFVPKMLVF